jgi:glycosyltransferase involved in cell wall biosynthesis
MIKGKKVAIVMPAYNAAKTLIQTYEETIAEDIVDEIIVVDDCSQDETVEIAGSLEKVHVCVHSKNLGYGGNQKTCYRTAIERGADIIIMVHPDYQYTPKLIPAMAGMLVNNLYDCVLGSRILGGETLKSGMPLWKYVANRFLTITENLLFYTTLSEYHTGYRAFLRETLEALPLDSNSNDFVFDNEILGQLLWNGFRIGEVSCPTKYHPEASSVGFFTSVKYGFGCLRVAFTYRLARWKWISSRLFPEAVPASPARNVNPC